MSINMERVRQWTGTLRTTNTPQATSNLAIRLDDGKVGMCCLGILSLMAGCEYEPPNMGTGSFGWTRAQVLAPLEAVEWLGCGTTRGGMYEEWDLIIDWPEDLATPPDRDPWGASQSYRTEITLKSAAGLNDGGFTFEQIADIIDHFGLAEEAVT